jgi:type VI secretion system secreted protein Hcp
MPCHRKIAALREEKMMKGMLFQPRRTAVVLFVTVLAAVSLFITPSTSWAAMTSYLHLTGATQGPILGDCSQSGREGAILSYSYGHDVSMQGGVPVHGMVQITKHSDISSPKLYQAIFSGERLTFTLDFYRINPEGSEEIYHSVVLEGARIVSIKPWTPLTFLEENKPYRNMELVAFDYESITWTDENSGTSYTSIKNTKP